MDGECCFHAFAADTKNCFSPHDAKLGNAFLPGLWKALTGQLAPGLAVLHYLALLIQVKRYCSAFT